MLLDLTDPVTGAAAWELHILYPGLQRFLKPHLKQTGEERSYLADPTQRQLLRVGGSAAALHYEVVGMYGRWAMHVIKIVRHLGRPSSPGLACLRGGEGGFPSGRRWFLPDLVLGTLAWSDCPFL